MAQYAVIVPTLNEAGNVSELVRRLENILQGLDWEIIFVDDNSKDGTLEELYNLAKSKPYVRYLRRLGRKGLASACVEGMMSSNADYMAVMDADLQHDETKLPELFNALSTGQANLAVASRYTGDGGTGEWSKSRVGISKLATWISRLFLKAPCSDPMSGFFALDREIIDKSAPKIQSQGFKILFDILSMPELDIRLKEIPYVFSSREIGESKLSSIVIVEFLWLLASKIFGRVIHTEFVLFCFVGFLGVFVHLLTVFIFFKQFSLSFVISQGIATLVAMTTNYLINNLLTFKDKKLHGKDFIKGYGKFVLACTVGALVNVAVANQLFESGLFWPLAAAAGTVVGAIFNYFFAKFTIWKDK